MSFNKIYSGMENAPDAIDKNFNKVDDWAGEIGDPALLAKLSEEGATNWDSKSLPQSDSGWIPFILLNGITTDSNENRAAYRKINNEVYFKGTIRGIKPGSAMKFAEVVLDYMPVAFFSTYVNSYSTVIDIGVVTVSNTTGVATVATESASNMTLTGVKYLVREGG